MHYHSEKAMHHRDILGEGAKKRKHLKNKKVKSATIMEEYKRGTLRSGSGAHVKSRPQAIAIMLSETGQSKKKHK
jgi:Family of unknown function (DUF6496)